MNPLVLDKRVGYHSRTWYWDLFHCGIMDPYRDKENYMPLRPSGKCIYIVKSKLRRLFAGLFRRPLQRPQASRVIFTLLIFPFYLPYILLKGGVLVYAHIQSNIPNTTVRFIVLDIFSHHYHTHLSLLFKLVVDAVPVFNQLPSEWSESSMCLPSMSKKAKMYLLTQVEYLAFHNYQSSTTVYIIRSV